MKIGVAIPTYIKHLNKLETLLDSIQKSTVLPDEVSVSCSSYYDSKCNIDFDRYPFKINIYFHMESKSASMNRNFAASMLNTDIISFMDSDDIIHPQRSEFILKSFSDNNCSALVHNYKFTNYIDDEFINQRYDDIDYKHEYVNTIGDVYPINNILHLPYANGHLSVLKSVFDRHKYDESEAVKYREDSEYCNRLVKNGIKISYILNPLSLYIK